MAAGTAALINGGLSLGMGAYQAIAGNKQRKDALEELNNYDRQLLDNAFKDIQISTEGVDLMRDENARTSANLIDSASNAGSRAIIGSAPRVSAATNNLNSGIANYLDEANNRREYAIAGDNARIEGIIEDRDNANIAALSSQANAGRQDTFSGLMGVASGLSYLGNNITSSNMPPPAVEPAAGTMAPAGTTFNNAPTATTLPTYPTASFNPNAANLPAPADAPMYNTPYFDFANSYQVPNSVPGPSAYNPFAGFPSYFNPPR